MYVAIGYLLIEDYKHPFYIGDTYNLQSRGAYNLQSRGAYNLQSIIAAPRKVIMAVLVFIWNVFVCT